MLYYPFLKFIAVFVGVDKTFITALELASPAVEIAGTATPTNMSVNIHF